MVKISGITTTETDLDNVAWMEGERDDGTPVKMDPASMNFGGGGGGGGVFTGQVLRVQHTETAGTQGGDSTTGAWNKRKLNTQAENSISGASHNTGTYVITLPAGS